MVVLGTATLTGVYGGYANLQDSIDATYREQAFHDTLVEFEPRPIETLDLTTSATWEARWVREAPITFEGALDPILARILSFPPAGEPTIDKLAYSSGGPPSEGAGEAVLEAGFAAHHGLVVGDTLAIATREGSASFRVSGVATSPEYLWPAKNVQEHMPDILRRWGVVWLRWDDAQALGGDVGVANQVLVLADDDATLNDAIAAVRASVGDENVLRVETQERQASHVVLGLLVNALNQIALILPLLFLAIVGLSTYVLLTRIVHQQRANVGLLLALGYEPRTVLLHYLSYAPIVAGIGATLGFLAGYALSFYVTSVFASFASLGNVPVPLRPSLLGVSLVVSFAFASLASVIPARHAARLRPSEAMRPPAPPASRHARAKQRARTTLPEGVRLGARNLARNPRRAAFTALGVSLAVGIIVVPQGLLDSFDGLVEDAVVKVQRADELVILSQPVPASSIDAAAALDGVEALEPIVQFPYALRLGDEEYDTIVNGLRQDADLLRLYDAAGTRHQPSRDGAYFSRVLERDGARAGETIEIFGEPVRVLGFVQASGRAIYVDLETAQRWSGLGENVNQALLDREAAADPAGVHQELSNALPVGATQDVPQAIEDTRSMLRLYYGFAYLILGFGVAIALAIVFNTITINVMEEKHDFATLRTLGVPTRTLASITTTETLVLAIPGAALGLVIGAILTRYFVAVFTSDTFVLDMSVTPATYAISFTLGVAVALISQLPSIRNVARIDLAAATRERAT